MTDLPRGAFEVLPQVVLQVCVPRELLRAYRALKARLLIVYFLQEGYGRPVRRDAHTKNLSDFFVLQKHSPIMSDWTNTCGLSVA